MADDKQHTDLKDNKYPEVAALPKPSDLSAPEPVTSRDPPKHKQAMIPNMNKDALAPADKVIDLSYIKATADHNDKEPIAPAMAAP